MALATTGDYATRVNELFWYMEKEFGMKFGDKDQGGTAVWTPALDDLIRGIGYTVSATETTAYADYKTLIATYVAYRNTRLALAGGPGT